jgi:hypothetical protein
MASDYHRLQNEERSKPSSSLAVTTTHALLAGRVQRKVRDRVAQLAGADHLRIGPKSRQFLPSQRLTNIRASITAEILGTRPELRIANLSAQTRTISGQNSRTKADCARNAATWRHFAHKGWSQCALSATRALRRGAGAIPPLRAKIR